MAAADFEQVARRFGTVVGLDDFTLSVDDGELVTIVGPSGCGKSTLLRLTAGLDRPTSGTIRVGERRIDTLPPHERDVAMVFQSYALYPHLSVRENLAFPLRMRKASRSERETRTREIADALDLAPLLERRPAQLSGGQRQRVALGRALVRRPALFLLDEPLSNLDARLRLDVRRYIRGLQRERAVTTLYVTHDQGEAMTLGDRVVVLRDGRIQQVDAPATIYERPANAFVAGFVGTPPMNLLPGVGSDDGITVGGQRIPARDVPIGQLVVGVRPEAFGAAMPGGLDAVLEPATSEILGNETLVGGAVGSERVTVRLPGVVRDVPPRLTAPLDRLHFFAADAAGARLR